MTSFFLTFLSRDLLASLESGEDSDFEIEIGKEPNAKVFRLHRFVLRSRSGFFREFLSQDPVDVDEHSKVSDRHLPFRKLDARVFDIVIRYLYGGIFPFEDFSSKTLFDILAAADELQIPDLVDFLDDRIVSLEESYCKRNFATVANFAQKHINARRLNEFCDHTFTDEPTSIIDCEDFNSLPRQTVVELVQNEKLHEGVAEIDIFEKVKEWGIAQLPDVSSNTAHWGLDQFDRLYEVLSDSLPHIRFLEIPAKEFSKKVLPFRRIIPDAQFTRILEFHLDRETDPPTSQRTTATSASFVSRQTIAEIPSPIPSPPPDEMTITGLTSPTNFQTIPTNLQIPSPTNFQTMDITSPTNFQTMDVPSPTDLQTMKIPPSPTNSQTMTTASFASQSTATASASFASQNTSSANQREMFESASSAGQGTTTTTTTAEYQNLYSTSILSDECQNLYCASVLMSENQASWISNFINDTYGDVVTQNEFELLLRGSRDGFSSEKFHELCDHQGPTVTVFKLHGFTNLIGGYNPLHWTSENEFCSTSESFIFSLGNENAVFSPVEHNELAIWCIPNYGPKFGIDLEMEGGKVSCERQEYVYPIVENDFQSGIWHSIEEYEVFRLIRIHE